MKIFSERIHPKHGDIFRILKNNTDYYLYMKVRDNEVLVKDNEPAYIRVGRNAVDPVYSEDNTPFEMDKANSYGLTGYWDKDDRNVKDNMLADLKTHYQFFNTICDLNDEYPDNKDFIEHIQKELFSNIIYVFDENGNSIELAKGSTIIDFAYKTKKDFVNVVLGAYVNNNLRILD